jgi:hypothetical protein
MNSSRSSSARAAGLPSPFPVSAALPPKLALRPVEPKHYATLPRYEGQQNKTAVGTPTTGILATRSCQMGAKGGSTLTKTKISAKFSPQLASDHSKPLSQFVADFAPIPILVTCLNEWQRAAITLIEVEVRQ